MHSNHIHMLIGIAFAFAGAYCAAKGVTNLGMWWGWLLGLAGIGFVAGGSVYALANLYGSIFRG